MNTIKYIYIYTYIYKIKWWQIKKIGLLSYLCYNHRVKKFDGWKKKDFW